ncbi:MAG: TonB-dependent receptor [Haliscomenobacter sp.]|uniref:TonB-dependent receptor n=1 Tax=Haliscomenobacter sp. TaxID=2717303 RepID=UPI0029A8BE0D|nr:TonB-dependent receptor [Haliscomenobacter sp.]MDX2067622.1 TonB-dependent receptor [Haliscomenobacter sp.]
MQKRVRFFSVVFTLLLTSSALLAQATLKGSVKDENGEALIAASVSVAGTTTGAITKLDGTYELPLPSGTHTINVSYTGYEAVAQVVTIGNQDVVLDFILKSSVTNLNEVVISVGSRNTLRTSTDTPLPIDILGAKDLVASGQTTFDKALTYRVPSFNSVQTPVNDATSLLDPYEIRNMGPSRTLILINGKRKNMSSLLYTQTSPGRGETGADISAIPQDAIERVEILRDGASAQYGSDAIAGVMNIILKKDVDKGGVTLRTGMTSEGDGEMFGVSVNNGARLGARGFLNYTLDLSKIGLANRPGTVDAEGEAADFGADIATVRSFLNEFPDAGNINGSPATTAMKFSVNTGGKVSENSEVYGNAAYIYKKVNSFANYRTPYWRTLSSFPYLTDFFGVTGANGQKRYVGYVPTFDGDLIDYHATAGFKSSRNGWNTDLSFTIGGNQQTYTVTNSHNRNDTKNPDGTNKYRENSPIIFDPGGTRFTHAVGNIDVSRRVSSIFSFAFGSEFRSEDFTVIEGDEASYEDGGADSFAGNDPRNSGTFNRYNVGAYADFAFDFTENFLINATARLENYSDFGDAFVWKISSRYKLADDNVVLRGSISTGFKAPTLHQIYTQKAQYSFVPGQGIQVGGLVSNVSREARLLGVPSLNPEKSTNFTLGIGLKPAPNFNITIDYFNIDLTDRIILSTEIKSTGGTTPLDKILADNNLSDLSFFVNALDTRTSGLDFVANYRAIKFGAGKLGVSLAGNVMLQNERVGAVKNPALIAGARQSVANATQEALFFTSRPKFKTILGIDYEVGRFIFTLGNTLFGPTKFKQQGLDDNLYTEFKTKLVTDLAITFQTSKNSTIALNINNLFNVLPEWEFKAENAAGETLLKDAAALKVNSNLITFNQRYSITTYDGSHFSQLGTIFNLSYNFRF